MPNAADSSSTNDTAETLKALRRLVSARGDAVSQTIANTNAVMKQMVTLSQELIKASYEQLEACDGMVRALDQEIAKLEPTVGTDVEEESIEW